MSNLFAVCQLSSGRPLEVKRVSLTADVQGEVAAIFSAQYREFFSKIDDEVPFGSDWKPDDNEVLYVDVPDQASAVIVAINGNPLELNVIGNDAFQNEGIRALVTKEGAGDTVRYHIQRFTAQQYLMRRFSLVLDRDTFKKLSEPAFTLDTSLVGVIEAGRLKFKSFHAIKRVFDINSIYYEATDQGIQEFSAHASLAVADVDKFCAACDQSMRKMITAISKAGVLNAISVDEIVQKAASLGLAINKNPAGKIIMPEDRAQAKQLLRFLDDSIYEAPLSALRYMTNSKRLFST